MFFLLWDSSLAAPQKILIGNMCGLIQSIKKIQSYINQELFNCDNPVLPEAKNRASQ